MAQPPRPAKVKKTDEKTPVDEVKLEIMSGPGALKNRRERVCFSVLIDPVHVELLQDFFAGRDRSTDNIISKCAKKAIWMTRKIRELNPNGGTFHVACASACDVGRTMCDEHSYYAANLLVQCNRIKPLQKMCEEICLEYLCVRTDEKKPLELRYTEYEKVITKPIMDLLTRAWEDAVVRGMICKCPRTGVMDARFDYDSPFEKYKRERVPHPEEIIIISKKDTTKCESFLSARFFVRFNRLVSVLPFLL